MRTLFLVVLTAVVLAWVTKFSMLLIGSSTAPPVQRMINSEPQQLDREVELLQDAHTNVVHDY